jgi:hypothetical protein
VIVKEALDKPSSQQFDGGEDDGSSVENTPTATSPITPIPSSVTITNSTKEEPSNNSDVYLKDNGRKLICISTHLMII